MRLPIILAACVGIGLCLYLGFHGLKVKSSTHYTSAENNDARWRTFTSAQSGVILAIVVALFWAIPSPQYDVKVVYKDRVITRQVKVQVPVYKGSRTVYQPSTYQGVYDKCIGSYGYKVDQGIMKICDDFAIKAVRESMPQPAMVEKIVYRVSTYKALFDDCNESHSINGGNNQSGKSLAEIRNERIQICGEVAQRGRTFR